MTVLAITTAIALTVSRGATATSTLTIAMGNLARMAVPAMTMSIVTPALAHQVSQAVAVRPTLTIACRLLASMAGVWTATTPTLATVTRATPAYFAKLK